MELHGLTSARRTSFIL